LLGPNNEGTFSVVEIKSIHCNKVPVLTVVAGQMCSVLVNISKFCLKWLKNAGGNIRKGMVLLDYKDKINVEACFSFKADIWSYDETV
jgi:GTPase